MCLGVMGMRAGIGETGFCFTWNILAQFSSKNRQIPLVFDEFFVILTHSVPI